VRRFSARRSFIAHPSLKYFANASTARRNSWRPAASQFAKGFHKMLAPETLIPGSTIAAQVAVRRLGGAAGPAGQLFPAGAAAPSRRVRARNCARSARRLDIHARRWACVANAFAVGAAEKELPLQTQALLCLQGGARFEHITTLKPVYCRRHVGPRGRAAEPGVRRLHSARRSLRCRQQAGLAG